MWGRCLRNNGTEAEAGHRTSLQGKERARASRHSRGTARDMLNSLSILQAQRPCALTLKEILPTSVRRQTENKGEWKMLKYFLSLSMMNLKTVIGKTWLNTWARNQETQLEGKQMQETKKKPSCPYKSQPKITIRTNMSLAEWCFLTVSRGLSPRTPDADLTDDSQISFWHHILHRTGVTLW